MVGYLLKNYCLLMNAGLMIFLLVTQPQEKRKNDVYMILIFMVILLVSIADYAERQITGNPDFVTPRYILAILAYCLRPLIFALLVVIVDREMSVKVLFWIPIAANALCYITTPFTHLTFYLEDAVYRRGSCYLMMALVCIFYGVILVRKLYRLFIRADWTEFFLVFLSAIFTLIAGFTESLAGLSTPIYLQTLSIVLMVYYLFLHIQNTKERDERRLLEIQAKEDELIRIGTELMVSQIRPHFLYNTLGSVKYLIGTDAEKAEQVLDRFSAYLRANAEAMSQKEPITFERELEHIRNYVFIEQTRFPYITVEYDIGDEIFDLPALSVQPLVENAIKHGIRGLQSGKVTIRTFFENDCHKILVIDNGVGFDVNKMEGHVGLKNVEKRLKYMSDGTMEISSRPGEGTRVTVSIPEKGDGEIENLFGR